MKRTGRKKTENKPKPPEHQWAVRPPVVSPKAKQQRKTFLDETTAYGRCNLLQSGDKENLPGKPDKKDTYALGSKGETQSQLDNRNQEEGGQETTNQP